jgi:hypothetical protein
MSVAAVAARRDRATAADRLVLAGILLAGWILVEVVVVRAYFWLQPACLVYGVVVAACGVAARRS